MNENPSLAEALQVLIGSQLSSVEFVADYIQLRFDGPCFTVYSHAQRVVNAEYVIAWGQAGFRDALCSLIGHLVEQTKVAELERLSLIFDNGVAWSLSLREEDRHGPEALMFTDDAKRVVFVE